MRTLITAALIALLCTFAAGCGDDAGDAPDAEAPDDPDAAPPDPDAAPPEATFTAFVIEQITNQTANDTDPVAYAAFATLADPDADNPAAYDALFP